MKNYFHISTGQFGYPQPKSKYKKTTYDPNEGCPTCSIGQKQISEFRFSGEPKPLKNQITGLNWVFDEIFIRGIVKNVFEMEKLTGCEFSSPLYNKTQKEIPEFYQLKVDSILQPSLLNNDLTTELCEYPKDEGLAKFLEAIDSKLIHGPFCVQKKINFPQGQILKFRKEAFYDQPDFVRTYEWFGSGGSANKPILVSEKVKEIIENNMFRGVQFSKVELI